MIGIAKGMVTTFKHLFKPTFTIQYPNVKRQLPERSRMSFALGIDESGAPQCKACLLCEKSCPDDAIIIESESVKARRDGCSLSSRSTWAAACTAAYAWSNARPRA